MGSISRSSPGLDERSFARAALVLFALVALPALQLSAQPATVIAAGDALKLRAPAFTFIEGESLARLKDGRSLRVELRLAILEGPGKSAIAEARQAFALSYDLWEERFAVAGAPSQSASHLTTTAAEAWCVDQLAVPIHALGASGRDRPFWIRLEYRILEGDATPPSEDAGYTLQGLIDRLSRRRKAEAKTHAIEAGPFRVPPPAPGRQSPR